MKKRIVFVVGLLIAVAMIAACSSQAMRYLNYRGNPDVAPTAGDFTIAVPGLSSPATIVFDEFAVPHIRAADEPSLAFAMGYIHARDRRFQMETLRLVAAGRIREMVGDQDASGSLAHLEIVSRAIYLIQDAKEILRTASPEDHALLDAYAAGVNAATEREPIPMEFRVLNYRPEPWTALDSTLITALVSFGLNKNWEQELGRLELIVHQLRTGSTIERALAIWKPRFDLPPHLIGERPAHDPFADIPPIAPELAAYLTEYVKTMNSPTAFTPPPVTLAANSPWDAFVHGGSHSNNWAMSGRWTGTGAGAAAYDPHMPLSIPPLGYLAHLRCDNCPGGSYEVIGAGFVGLPAISFGTNGNVTWGPTSNWADVADLYVEKPVPGQANACYDGRGAAAPFDVRREVFRIRQSNGTLKTETKTVRSSRHGVLLNDFVDRLPPDFPLVALQRDHQKGKPITALRHLYRAHNVTEARLALNDFAAMVGHWALSDRQGNIAYCGPLYLPKRAHHLGTVPVPGWVETYDWREFVPPDQLPWIENQVVQPESLGYPINFEGDVPHRYARIAQVLGAGRGARPLAEQIGALQTDDLDLGWPEVRPLFTRALAPLENDDDRLAAQAASILLTWDGRCDPNAVAPVLFHSLCAFLFKRAMEDEVSPATLQFLLTYFNAEPLVYSILGDENNPAWGDRGAGPRTPVDEVIRETFRLAVHELAKKYGDKITRWRWRDAATLMLMHPFGGSSALAGFVNRGPLPTRGANNTVNKQQFPRIGLVTFPVKYGPVLRVAIDLSDLRGSRMSVPGGESGRPSSPHYDDILPLYLRGEGVSMDTDFARIEAHATGRIHLLPQ
jgi:penicillin amidase